MTKPSFALTVSEMSQAFRDRTLSPVTVMEDVLARTQEKNPQINALIFVNGEDALAKARESEQRWKDGTALSEIDGVPVSLKDSIAEASRPMVRGAKPNLDNGPVGYDAPPTARLKEAGAIVWAKTTMPDFGMFGAGVSSAVWSTRNPWNLDCNTSGSSSGGAASVAARCGPASIGSDSAGSVRLPANFCGLVGIKPTQGRIPHLPPSPIRSAGPLTRTVLDNAMMMDVLSRPDARDYGALPPQETDFAVNLGRSLKGVRVGLLMEGIGGTRAHASVAAAVENTARLLEAQGAVVEPIGNVVPESFYEDFQKTVVMRGALEWRSLPPERQGDILPTLIRWFETADATGALEWTERQSRVDKAKAVALTQMLDFDYIVSPTATVSAYPAEEVVICDQSFELLVFTAMANLIGNPSISVPCAVDPENGMPIGVQISGHRFDDLGVLQLAKAVEDLCDLGLDWPA